MTNPGWTLDDQTAFNYLAAGILGTAGDFRYPFYALDGDECDASPPHSLFQQALNMVAVLILRAGHPLPQGLGQWLDMFGQPLANWWPGTLPEGIRPHDALLFDLRPEDWVGPYLEGCGLDESVRRGLWYFQTDLDQAGIRVLQQWCTQQNRPEVYTAFREFLIRHPVVTQEQYLTFQGRYPEVPVRLKMFYVSPSPSALHDGHYWICPYCKGLLRWVGDEPRCTRHSVCGRMTRKYKERTAQAQASIYQVLRAGVHWRVCVAGLPEVQLYDWLKHRCGAVLTTVLLWPGVDRYDLQLEFATGEVWAVDVKDYANPGKLRRELDKTRAPYKLPDKPWTRAFYVVPQYRLTWVGGYIAEARAAQLGVGVAVVGQSEFKRRVEAKLRAAQGRQEQAGDREQRVV